jgi:2-oxoglutarate ferredoxin oxidoreductase subunit gamma
MNKASLDRFEEAVQPKGFLLLNTSLIDRGAERQDLTVVRVPANQIAEKAGTVQVTNMAALGAYVGARRIVSLDSVLQALRRMIPEHRKELLSVNEEALRQGAEVARTQIS